MVQLSATALATAAANDPRSNGRGGWDEAARFEAFVSAVECGRPFLWWAHVASAGWFLGGPRHVLTRDEARASYRAGAATPADAAARSPPLPLDKVSRVCVREKERRSVSKKKEKGQTMLPQVRVLLAAFTAPSAAPLLCMLSIVGPLRLSCVALSFAPGVPPASSHS